MFVKSESLFNLQIITNKANNKALLHIKDILNTI